MEDLGINIGGALLGAIIGCFLSLHLQNRSDNKKVTSLKSEFLQSIDDHIGLYRANLNYLIKASAFNNYIEIKSEKFICYPTLDFSYLETLHLEILKTNASLICQYRAISRLILCRDLITPDYDELLRLFESSSIGLSPSDVNKFNRLCVICSACVVDVLYLLLKIKNQNADFSVDNIEVLDVRRSYVLNQLNLAF